MKIQITGGSRNTAFRLPTKFLLNRTVLLRISSAAGLGHASVHIPPKAADGLIEELERIKKKNGGWTLVEVESADGRHIRIEI